MESRQQTEEVGEKWGPAEGGQEKQCDPHSQKAPRLETLVPPRAVEEARRRLNNSRLNSQASYFFKDKKCLPILRGGKQHHSVDLCPLQDTALFFFSSLVTLILNIVTFPCLHVLTSLPCLTLKSTFVPLTSLKLLLPLLIRWEL